MRASIAYLTVDFLSVGSLSVNYYVAMMLHALEGRLEVERLAVFSHRDSHQPEQPLASVMADHGIGSYNRQVKVVSVNCFDCGDYMDELCSYDILVVTCYYWGKVIEELKRKRQSRPRVIYWMPSILLHEYVVNRQRKWYRFDFGVDLQKKTIEGADHLIFISESDAFYARQYFGRDIAPSSIIYPASMMDDAWLELPAPTAASATRPVRFGFAGRWDYRKGVHLLLDGFLGYYTEFGNASLHLLTEPLEDIKEVESVLDEHLARGFYRLFECGAISFSDWQPVRRDYLAFLKSCDVLILPSLYDPFNIIAYDCFRLNIPLVLSRFCGVEEILPDKSRRVIKVNPFDTGEICSAMKRLAAPAECDSACGTVKVSYDAADMFEQTLAVYRGLLN
jgi:glycosyltransferase involved in cell wall biosynthesis